MGEIPKTKNRYRIVFCFKKSDRDLYDLSDQYEIWIVATQEDFENRGAALRQNAVEEKLVGMGLHHLFVHSYFSPPLHKAIEDSLIEKFPSVVSVSPRYANSDHGKDYKQGELLGVPVKWNIFNYGEILQICPEVGYELPGPNDPLPTGETFFNEG